MIPQYPIPFAISVLFALATAYGLFALRSDRTRLLLLLSAGVILRLVIALQDPLQMQNWPLNDDSHYYFNIAWNLTHGGGLQHDSFNSTTGFQPLFLLLMAPIYALMDSKLAAVNAVLVMQSGIGLLFALTLYRLIKHVGGTAAGLLAVAAWAVSPTFLHADLSGLETNLALLTTCLTVWYYLARVIDGEGRARYVKLGLLIGVGFLARIDSGLLGPVLVADILRREFRNRRLGDLLLNIVLMTLAAAVPVIPWVAYNLYKVGSVLPSSGQAVRFMSLAYGYHFFGGNTETRGYFDVHQIPFKYYKVTAHRAIAKIFVLLTRAFPLWAGLPLILAGLYVGRRTLLHSLWKFAFFFAFIIGLFYAYTTYIFGQWFFDRYMLPFAIGYLLLLAAALPIVSAELEPGGRLARFRMVPRIGIPLLLGWLLFGSLERFERHVIRADPSGLYEVAVWVNENTPEDAVIGAFQTGIVGYYLEREFYGLDGKINQDALGAMKGMTIDRYVDEKEIDYLMDWPWILNDLFVNRASNPDYLTEKKLVWKGPYDVYQLRGDPSRHPDLPAEP